jgi:group I intron endonuclease
MSSIYSIYISTNKITGKSYIGFDSDWPNRKICHKRRLSETNNIKFYNALRKYGWDSFEWNVIYQSKDAKHCLSIMEPFFIREYNTFKNGYNSTIGGEGVLGYTHNAERREKIRLNNIGRKQSQQTKELRSSIMRKIWETRDRTISSEQRSKISKGLMGNIPWNKGKKTGLPSPNRKSVVINGTYYSCKMDAMTHLGVSLYKLNKMITNDAKLRQQ